MADDTLTAERPDAVFPDWPPRGRVKPLLGRRAYWKARRLLRRLLRRGLGRPQRDPAPFKFDLDAVYRVAAQGERETRPAALGGALRTVSSPVEALDAAFAALAVAIAAQNRPCTAGLLAFLELTYVESDRDIGAARMGASVRRNVAAPAGTPLARLAFDKGWQTLATGVRHLLEAMPNEPPSPHFERPPHRAVGPKLVVLEMSGGLGNQLFQYAAALAYARRTGTELRLDLWHYERHDAFRECLLGRLRLRVRRASTLDAWLARRRYHRETRGATDDFILGTHGSAMLRGYWPHPRYFADVVPTIRRRFLPRDPAISARARALVEAARDADKPVVGVHIRRGDRAPGGAAYAPFSTLPASYYREAARLFPGASFLVFSDTADDIAWCRDHLGIGEAARVRFGDGVDPIVDMFALANCDHVILSSGTFSWWAGYLGERPGRRVIVPNPLQAASPERVRLPAVPPSLPGWEELTLPPEPLCFPQAIQEP